MEFGTGMVNINNLTEMVEYFEILGDKEEYIDTFKGLCEFEDFFPCDPVYINLHGEAWLIPVTIDEIFHITDIEKK